MSERPTAILEALDETGNGVRVEFRWTGERFQHTIVGVHGRSAVPILISVQGAESPALVELHEQSGALLLTGADSWRHWSLSVESRQHSAKGIALDFACRSKKQSRELSIVYQACHDARVRLVDDRLAETSTPDTAIVLANLEPATVMQSIAPNSLVLSAHAEASAANRHTFRWRYAVRSARRPE